MTMYSGRARVIANGELIDSKPGASIDLGGVQRSGVVNEHSSGYSEAPKQSRVEMEVAIKKGDSVERFRNITNGTVHFTLDTGQNFIVKNAFTEDTLSINSGSLKLVFMGDAAQEVVS
jgi:hypothetical protein